MTERDMGKPRVWRRPGGNSQVSSFASDSQQHARRQGPEARQHLAGAGHQGQACLGFDSRRDVKEKRERREGARGVNGKTTQLRGGGNLNGYCESVQWREKEELRLNPDTVPAGGAWKKSVDEGAKF